MAKKKPQEFDRGECFEFAYHFHDLSGEILGAARDAHKKSTIHEAPRQVGNALNSVRELRQLGRFKGALSAAQKELQKAKRILEKKEPSKKDRDDVFYGLHRLHSKVFKEMYRPARKGCGLNGKQ